MYSVNLARNIVARRGCEVSKTKGSVFRIPASERLDAGKSRTKSSGVVRKLVHIESKSMMRVKEVVKNVLRSSISVRQYSTEPPAVAESVKATDAFVASAVEKPAVPPPVEGLIWSNEGLTRLLDPANWSGVMDPVFYFVQANIELVHNLSGLPWWSTAIAFAVLVRVVTFPLQIRQMRMAAISARLKPQLDEIKAKYMYSAAGQSAGENAMKMSNESRELMAKNGVNPLAMLTNTLPQAAAMISGFVVFRVIANDPTAILHQVWLNSGAFWFSNLCAADPLMLLPALSTVTTATLLLVSPMPQFSRRTVYIITACISAASFAFTMSFPAIIHLFWTGSSTLTLLTTTLLRSPFGKNLFKIPESSLAADSANAPKQILYDSPLSSRPKIAVPPAAPTQQASATSSQTPPTQTPPAPQAQHTPPTHPNQPLKSTVRSTIISTDKPKSKKTSKS